MYKNISSLDRFLADIKLYLSESENAELLQKVSALKCYISKHDINTSTNWKLAELNYVRVKVTTIS